MVSQKNKKEPDLPVSLQEIKPLTNSYGEYKLMRIIQAMVDAVLVYNPNLGEVQLCNPAFESVFHVTQEQLIQQPLQHAFKILKPEIAQLVLQAIEAQETSSHEITFYNHYQKQTFLFYTLPIEDNGQVSEIVAVFHNITALKKTEKMRRDFVANVSHELRTPLSAISGYAETLLEGALNDEAVVKDFIQIIFNHSQRLSQLVRDLLDLSKLESSETPFDLQPTRLSALIQKVITLSEKHRSEKNIQLHYEPRSDLPLVLAHETSIEQVLTNLLDNAIKYSPYDGHIEIGLQHQGPFLQVNVSDTGIGIEAKHIPRLFERFYRVDKARSRDMGGTGLGLAIVKHIIQLHGGEVWVESQPRKGSIFHFTLQAVKD